MKKCLFVLTSVVFSMFLMMGLNSCGLTDNPILGLDDVEKSDLTTPLFLSYDNTMDKSTKKIWAFNATQAAKGTITVVGSDLLRIQADALYASWSITGKKITLGEEKVYDIKKVQVFNYNAIAFSGYICIPSSNKSLDGYYYEDEWMSHGLTPQAFWDALNKSYLDGKYVEIKLKK